ncbi:hypothetical protein [Falsiroseomonas tokyonensis]|uniref:Uncharacterized protein n=1 Tax=Falsiroseomonas tokyonensis TaxID=430521 RepID=A0ABV7C038_9PROT|nr:hypothetical protein [Falsiroseomonas tokyonensis]MBU8540846.1 hypothetical protein [Falsiroseomonas tokyonensis]
MNAIPDGPPRLAMCDVTGFVLPAQRGPDALGRAAIGIDAALMRLFPEGPIGGGTGVDDAWRQLRVALGLEVRR